MGLSYVTTSYVINLLLLAPPFVIPLFRLIFTCCFLTKESPRAAIDLKKLRLVRPGDDLRSKRPMTLNGSTSYIWSKFAYENRLFSRGQLDLNTSSCALRGDRELVDRFGPGGHGLTVCR